MNKIVIITDNFPFKPGENTFILPEIEELKKSYEIEIIAAGIEKETPDFYKKFDLDGIKISKVTYPEFNLKRRVFIVLKCLFSVNYYKNIFSGKCSFKTFMTRESECRNFYLVAYYFNKYLKDNGYFDKDSLLRTTFYSFWSNSNLLALCLEKKKNKNIKIVARANGYDLYNERMLGLHQPYKSLMDKMINFQLFDAELNRKYYIDHFAYDKTNSKYILAYLGIPDRGIERYKRSNNIRVVSCASLIPLKRVNLIIDELSLINDKNIEWIHFGDGELNSELKELAKTKLGSNIKYDFKGYVDNKDIVKYYKNNSIDLFIHLSETEGCPVSLSEAASFGIPIIATDAGGVKEIVSDEMGKLIPVDFKKGTVADFINYFCTLNNDEVLKYRETARKVFLEKFDTKNNSKKLLHLFDNLNKKRICHVTSAHSRYDGRIFLKQCTSLVKKYDVTLLCCDTLKNEIKNNVKIVSINKKFNNIFERMFLSKKYLKNKCLEIDADVYEFHDSELLSLVKYVKKKDKKVIFDSHEDYPALFLEREWIPNVFRKILKIIYEKYETKVLKKVDYVLCASDHIKNRIEKINRNCVVIPNYPILDKIEKISNESNDIKLCFAGGISEDWNHKAIVNAIQELDNVKYLIAGNCSDEYKDKLKKIDVNNKVEFLGRLKYDDVKKLYSECDIGIALCSYRPNVDYKNGSLGITKIFEYMMFELPVIFTDFTVYKDINNKKQFGLSVNPNSEDDIKVAINYFKKNRKKIEEYGKNGRELVTNDYNWNILEKELFDIYEYFD